MNKLIIVESPTKAKTISRFLGDKKGYRVTSTMGHLRDLPKSKLGVEIADGKRFAVKPIYEVVANKKKTVLELKRLAKKADQVILAADPDREGEAIAYHAAVVMDLLDNKKLTRVVFHEITPEAIKKALAHSRAINMDLVDAQQARRVLDRIVGYKLSPLLWRKVRRGLSAGRVQSVALRLVVEREKEIEKFKLQNFWRVFGVFYSKNDRQKFIAELVKIDGKPVESFKYHQLFAGRYRVTKTIFDRRQKAEGTISSLPFAPMVEKAKEKQTLRRPSPPFTTSTLQQTAARRFGWSSKLTMRIAQSLYEKGLITYHRTDSIRVSSQVLTKMRKLIRDSFGEDYLSEKTVFYKTKSKLAQEAHEAIRPTKLTQEKIEHNDRRSAKLYQLIWQKAIASQMAPARLAVTDLVIKDGNYLFKTKGTRLVFDGFSRVYPTVFSQISLPKVQEGEKINYFGLGISQHQTKSPPRYSEASLIALLEKQGIGRPSTYAPIISIIQQRSYVEKEEGRFKATSLGEAVSTFLTNYFPDILSLPFTARMEEDLDRIARGNKKWTKVIKEFFLPFEKKFVAVKEKAERVKIKTEKIDEKCPDCKKGDLIIRVGRFGKFIACSRFPDCKYTRPFVVEAGFACSDCGAPAVVKKSKKGRRFYGCSNYPSCKWASWKKPRLKVSI